MWERVRCNMFSVSLYNEKSLMCGHNDHVHPQHQLNKLKINNAIVASFLFCFLFVCCFLV